MASQHPDIEKVLFTQEDIDGIVSRLGEQITRDYAGKDLVLIAVLRGAVVFMGDLMRKIALPTNIDFMAVSSYGDGVKSSGIVRDVYKRQAHNMACRCVLSMPILMMNRAISRRLPARCAMPRRGGMSASSAPRRGHRERRLVSAPRTRLRIARKRF